MRRRSFLSLLGIVIFIAIINVIAWMSTAFCDFYVHSIHPLWVHTYSRLTSIVPFSVGEIMIVAGLMITVIAVMLGFAAVIFLIGFRSRSIYPKVMKFCKTYFTAYAWIFTGVLVVMTLNCFIPFHCSSLEEKYGMLSGLQADGSLLLDFQSKEYTLEELAGLRDYVVIKTNELSTMVNRDDAGNIIYPDNMEELAIDAMLNLSKDYKQLEGFYPTPKQFTFSGFFSQQKMKGYFFPFSMEINYNAMMHKINRPATICHEYAHLKGFMYEEEANMIGFLACVNSPDVTFQYSGYLSILNYVNNEFYEALNKNHSIYNSHVRISPLVKSENVFLEKETWVKVEEKAMIKTEVVDKVSDKLSETTLVLNGIEDGMLSYTRVVGLLLHYYDGSIEVQQMLAEPEYLVQVEK